MSNNELIDITFHAYAVVDSAPIYITERSHLYHLEPSGISTPYTESLTSYIARLALVHNVLPKTLVLEEIIPVVDEPITSPRQYSKLNAFWTQNSRVVNGISDTTSAWVEALEMLTQRSDLHLLTMLTWKDVFPIEKLLRIHRAWCPLCLEEWKQNNHSLYEPLLWSLEVIKICSRHQQVLQTNCLNHSCVQTMSPLAQHTMPGFCSKCLSWLGSSENLTSSTHGALDQDELTWQQWVVPAVGEIISAAPSLKESPPKARMAQNLRMCVEYLADGNMSALSRHLRYKNVQTLWSWVNGDSLPHFETFLRLCYSLNIYPVDFLTTDLEQHAFDHTFILQPDPSQPAPTIQRSKPDVLEQMLEEKLAADPPLSLLAVARCVGKSATTIRQSFPGLARLIVDRYSTWNKQKKLEQGINKILQGEQILSLNETAEILGQDVDSLQHRFPDQCNEIAVRYRNGLDIEKMGRELEAIVSSSEHPSLKAVAKSLFNN